MDGRARTNRRGRPPVPTEVWAAVRADYVAGLSATDCCARHGVGRSALRHRAAREGWRRADMPWIPANDPRDPWDEGRELEHRVGGDIDKIETWQLSEVAHRRMLRAVLRGDAAGAMRWHRVRLVLDAEAEAAERFAEEDVALPELIRMFRPDLAREHDRREALKANPSDHPDHSDHSDDPDDPDDLRDFPGRLRGERPR